MIRNGICLLLLSLGLWACNTDSGSDPSKTSEQRFILALLDSVEVPIMAGYVSILAAHPSDGRLLLQTHQGDGTIYDISADGEVLQVFEYPKEGPVSVGAMLMSATYFEDGYALMGVGYVGIYDAEFSPIKILRLPMSSGGMIYIGANHLQNIEVDGKPKLLIMYGPDTQESKITAAYYEEYNMLTLFDPETESFQAYGRFHEGSKFRAGRTYFFLRPFYQAIGNRTKVIMDSDTVMYTFDAQGQEIDRHLIPFDKFLPFRGYTLGEQAYEEQRERREIQGTIVSFWHTQGLDVVQYTSGVSRAELDQLAPRLETEGRSLFTEVDPTKMVILKDGQAVSEVLKLPKQVYTLGMVDRKGNFWATQNVDALEEEPEFVTLYKLRIQALNL